MSFGSKPSPQMAAPSVEADPPPNPPMFGSNAIPGQRQRSQAKANQGFGSTILGGGPEATTSKKTLIGQ